LPTVGKCGPPVGKLIKLTYQVQPPKLTPADIEKLKQAAMSAADAK